MTIKILGSDDGTGNTDLTAENLCVAKFTAAANGLLTEFRIKVPAGASGYVKLALYTDNTNTPGTVLGSVGSTAVSAGWNIIPVSGILITMGVSYWIGFNSATTFVKWLAGLGLGIVKYKSYPYASSFPNDPTGLVGGEGNLLALLAGWGNVGKRKKSMIF